jgi:hypothetical protein
MKTFKIGDREIYFSNSWEDMTLKQWIEFYKLNERRNKENMVEDYYLLSILEVLCNVFPGELDDMSLTEYQEHLKELEFMLENPKLKEVGPVLVGDKLYGFKQNLSELTTGEYITIKTLQGRYENNLDGLPFILSVIFRPVTEVKDEETGEISYVQERFDTKNLDWRADIIYNNVKALDVMKGINFFFNGKNDL